MPPNALWENNIAKLHHNINDYLSKCQKPKQFLVFTPKDNINIVKQLADRHETRYYQLPFIFPKQRTETFSNLISKIKHLCHQLTYTFKL